MYQLWDSCVIYLFLQNVAMQDTNIVAYFAVPSGQLCSYQWVHALAHIFMKYKYYYSECMF